jgi:hypothetical protein
MKEMCRRCKDSDVQREADGIVWGKGFPPDALGPRCFDCISEQLGYYVEMSVRKRDHQWAIYLLPVKGNDNE